MRRPDDAPELRSAQYIAVRQLLLDEIARVEREVIIENNSKRMQEEADTWAV
jgi:hypothetical protein